MCFLAVAINYIDRANLGVAVPMIQKEYGIDPALMGLILSAFFWSYVLMQLPGGWLIDKFGSRLTYTVATLIMSVATLATAFAGGVASLIACRMVLGIGEAFCYPVNAKVTSLWFRRSERGLATGVWASGSRVGSAMTLPLVAFIIANFGWREAFLVTGAIGLVWMVLWYVLYRDPKNHSAVTAEQLAVLEADYAVKAGAKRIRYAELFRYRTIWGMMIGFFCLNFVIYFYTTWFPSYLTQSRGFSLAKLGTLGLVPGLVAIPAGWLGGYLSDRLFKGGWSLTAARKTCLVGGLLASSVVALAPLVPGDAAALTLLAISYSGLAFAGANIWTLPGDVAPTPAHVASISGIQNFASNLAGIAITTFTGVMVSITQGSFVVPLAVAGTLSIIGACSYLFIVGEIAPLKSPDDEAEGSALAAGATPSKA
ncbi:MFS transporter [Methylobacterium sp. E-005]|uniref:MFS transporter n=1 Tax=Methylobacterium sp. E-005 TaxID=2836549 RepID=UPI001FBBA3C3|nr:MFS transporter [Methylobacterium sp. E-005]MCJ2087652.1 MFS transporter [Methylobacterium sp. E-005]